MAKILFALRSIPDKKPTPELIQEKILNGYIHKTKVDSLYFVETQFKLTYGICSFTTRPTYSDGSPLLEEGEDFSIKQDMLRVFSRMMVKEFPDVVSSVSFNHILNVSSSLIPEEMDIFQVSEMMSDYYHSVSETAKHIAAINKVRAEISKSS